MPDTGCLLLSLLSVVVGGMFILVPDALLKLSGALNRTPATLDRWLIRHRYLAGLLAFGASYAFFRLALL